MKILSIADANYLAGFIDGDGSIIAQIVPREDYILKYQIRVSVLCIQKVSRIHHLQHFQIQIGKGTVRKRNDEIAEFSIVGHNNVSGFLKQIQPYLRIKKKQANLVLRICEQLNLTERNPRKFLELCSLADHIAELNDSKNRIHTKETVQNKFLDLGFIKE